MTLLIGGQTARLPWNCFSSLQSQGLTDSGVIQNIHHPCQQKQCFMTGTAYNHYGVLFADLLVWWINVTMPLDIYMCRDCIILITQCQDVDYSKQYMGECNTDLDDCSTNWKSTITIQKQKLDKACG